MLDRSGLTLPQLIALREQLVALKDHLRET